MPQSPRRWEGPQLRRARLLLVLLLLVVVVVLLLLLLLLQWACGCWLL